MPSSPTARRSFIPYPSLFPFLALSRPPFSSPFLLPPFFPLSLPHSPLHQCILFFISLPTFFIYLFYSLSLLSWVSLFPFSFLSLFFFLCKYISSARFPHTPFHSMQDKVRQVQVEPCRSGLLRAYLPTLSYLPYKVCEYVSSVR